MTFVLAAPIFDLNNLKVLNDMYMFDTQSSVWTEMKVEGDVPFSRIDFGFVTAMEKIYLFGGAWYYGNGFGN